MATYATRNCLHCGTQFTADKNNPDKRYCTQYCWTQSRKTAYEPRPCKLCGVEFTPTSQASKKYCSTACGETQKGRRGHLPGKRSIFTCKWCGKEFEAWTYRNPTMCSRQCTSEYGAQQLKLLGRPEKPHLRVTQNCIICGKEYKVLKSYLTKRVSKCCSRECGGKLISQTQIGPNHHAYIGGTRFPDRGTNWAAQRKRALERDGYKCRVCGKKIGKVKHDYGVHHITPYKAYAGDYQAANKLSNLITLCRVCHPKAEKGVIYVQRSLL
jgi:5-methylcytosine-specific restriction endonuclease McrA